MGRRPAPMAARADVAPWLFAADELAMHSHRVRHAHAAQLSFRQRRHLGQRAAEHQSTSFGHDLQVTRGLGVVRGLHVGWQVEEWRAALEEPPLPPGVVLPGRVPHPACELILLAPHDDSLVGHVGEAPDCAVDDVDDVPGAVGQLIFEFRPAGLANCVHALRQEAGVPQNPFLPPTPLAMVRGGQGVADVQYLSGRDACPAQGANVHSDSLTLVGSGYL